MIQLEKINIEYLVGVIFLGIALLIGVMNGEKELAGNIAAGIVGYIGGRGISHAQKDNTQKPPAPKPEPTMKPKMEDFTWKEQK